jgi:hypothetical protein
VTIFAIDPGPRTSGTVFIQPSGKAWGADPKMDNDYLLGLLRTDLYASVIACESIEAMYAHVGKETIQTIRFIGRIQEACHQSRRKLVMLSPQEVKKIVCGTASAKDPAVRQALIDKIGPPGTKKEPGKTYGVSSHAWRALAVGYAAQLSDSDHDSHDETTYNELP